jgi:hypothetical protein
MGGYICTCNQLVYASVDFDLAFDSDKFRLQNTKTRERFKLETE